MTVQLLERGDRTRSWRDRRGLIASLLRIDVVLIGTALVLTAVGLVMVYSATRNEPNYEPTYFLKRQALYALLGVLTMVVTMAIDYRRLEEWGYVVYGTTLVALVGVRAVGRVGLGAIREISLGPLSVQPSEFAVFGLIIAVALFVQHHEEDLGLKSVVTLLGIAGAPMLLVYLQPDLGTTLIMAVILIALLVLGGIKMRYLFALCASVALIFLFAHEVHLLHGYQLQRLGCFLHQNSTSTQYQTCNYNLNQAKTAIGAGGLRGTGLFNGSETANGFVPEAYADFIFAAVGEQLGFVGSVAVVGLYALLLLRMFRAVQLARTTLGRLVCGGVLFFIVFSVFQNIGMSIGIMPITGIPLPFISYGGSALIASFAGIGLVANVEARRGGHRV